MKPEEIRATVVADSGIAKNGGPAVLKFAKKYDLNHKTISSHCTGKLWPGRWAMAFYKLIRERNNVRYHCETKRSSDMLTELGKVLRKIRIYRGLRLYDMAQGLGKSSAWLSYIETGRRKAPLGLADEIADLYSLTADERKELYEAASESIEPLHR